MKMTVAVRRRFDIADPEGKTVAAALHDLGFKEVGQVRFGRTITIDLDETDLGRARARVTEMCERLLANPVIEDYEVTVEE